MYFPVTVPYKTNPVMNKNTGSVYELVTDLNHRLSKTYEIERWGKDLYGCRRPDLVIKACEILNIPITSDILEFAYRFREDVAIMHKGILEAICFCYPSSWIPNERLGLSLAEIHGPVADGEMLRKMSQRIAETMATQSSFRRYVWTITTTKELSNHPKLEKPSITNNTAIDNLFFRMETQTTLPLGDNESSLFFVKVDTCPLNEFWVDNEKRQVIIDSVNSMSDNVLEYKNLFKIKEILNRNTEAL